MINILHLYYDILNLYGENANLRCIEHNLKLNNIKYKIDYKSLEDKIDINKYDIIYIGSGDEESIDLCTKHLITLKDDFIKYINSNKYLFLTGNAMYMFGKTINSKEASNIFEYNTEYLNENIFKNASTNRIVGETKSTTNLIKEPIIGFQNRCGIITDITIPLFKTINKYSNDLKSLNEGFTYKNVYATQNIGPLFIRNPYLLDYFLNKILKEHKLKYKSLDKTSINAYEKYINQK